uniref:Peptide transporter PTR2 n=1 Tax=Aegilops tauschii TaxID=37682 RepID=M8APU9_AEGTA
MAGAAPADEDGSPKKTKQGGFKTMPFILANEVCDRFATAGFNANMITYLTQQLHLPLVEASNLLTNFMGTAAFTPVVAAAIKKRKEAMPEDAGMLYQNKELDAPIAADGRLLHTNQLRQVINLELVHLVVSSMFLDRAAIVTTTDAVDSGDEPDLWRLATVHRVEELKSIVRMLPLWAASITLIAAASHNFTFAIQQSRTMDRRLTPRFEIPPASMIIFTTLTMLVSLSLYDRVFVPLARRYTSRQAGISYFQRMGAGLAVSVLGVLAGALVEGKRRRAAAEHGLLDSPGTTVPISVFWLVPQYALHGVSDALSTVAHMEFLYDQSPESMRSSSAALFWVAGSLGNYLGTLLVTVVQSASGGEWLQDNINRGRLDYYYWLVTLLMALNLAYYIACFHFYTLKSFDVEGNGAQRRQDDGEGQSRSAERETELDAGRIGASKNCA